MRSRMKEDGYSLVPYDRYRCIFVRIPKCATRSVARSLFGSLGGGHMTIDDYRKAYSASEFYGYYKFAIVRNPWDRLVSAYFYLKKGGIHEGDQTWFKDNISHFEDFSDFVRRWLTTSNARHSLHFRPQHEYVCTGNDQLSVDFVARFEQLSADYEVISARLGVDTTLRHINASNNRMRSYQSYFDKDTQRIAAEVYARDISLFGYSFGR